MRKYKARRVALGKDIPEYANNIKRAM